MILILFDGNKITDDAHFSVTYRLDRLKPRALKFKGSPTKVYNIFNTVFGLSHLRFHSVQGLKNQLVRGPYCTF